MVKSNIETTNKLTMIAQMTNDAKFQILEFEKLDGGINTASLIKTQEINEKNIRLRQVRIILEDSIVAIENNKISYFFGDISVINKKAKPMTFSKKFFTGKLLEEDEDIIKPLYEGTGEIFLKPDFKNYALIELEEEEIVVASDNFVCSEGSIEIQESIENSMKVYKLLGSGIVILELPVPEHEIFKCNLSNNTLKTDGSLVVLRNSSIEYSTEISKNSLDEENPKMLNVFSGSGEIWVLPTKEVYKSI